MDLQAQRCERSRHGLGGHRLRLVWLVAQEDRERRDLYRKRFRGREGHSCRRNRRHYLAGNGDVPGRRCRQVRARQFHGRHERRRPLHRAGDAQADFSKNVSATGITGTIDQFVGADGNARNWEVELMGSAISDGGLIRALNADGRTEPVAADAGAKTKWTIDGSAAAASGQWTGTLRNNGTDGVPQVTTGTFYSEYGTAGRMVGAFGANHQ